MEPTATASWPMYRWQKPPILPNAYASAAFSSKRRMSSIWRSIWRRRSLWATSVDWEGAVAVAMGSSSGLPGRRRARGLLPGVIARAHQRASLHMPESHLQPQPLQLGKLVGGVPARDRQVVCEGSQILTQREDLDVLRAQVAHRDQQLVPLLAQAADDPRLGAQLRRDRPGSPE